MSINPSQHNAFRLEVMIEDVGVEILRQDRESMLSKMKEGENLANFDYNRYHNLPEVGQGRLLDILKHTEQTHRTSRCLDYNKSLLSTLVTFLDGRKGLNL